MLDDGESLSSALMVAAGVAVFNPGEDGGTEPAQEAEMLRAVTTLVELGHDVNAVNYRGETPLQGAAFRGGEHRRPVSGRPGRRSRRAQ